jgi:hypothetical protein
MASRSPMTRVLVAACVAVTVALGTWPAGAAQTGSGIWVYNCHFTIAIVNMTDQTLKFHGQVKSQGYETQVYLLGAITDNAYSVAPWSTWTWGCCAHHQMDPTWFDGTITLTGKSEWAFGIKATSQDASGDPKKGTWFSLVPADPSTQQWAAPNAYSYLRWATPVNDLKMHNIMTLIGSEAMVAMYSPDNVNIVVVVQEYAGEREFDASKDPNSYVGWRLDWVDNSGGSVPGQ